MAISKEERRTPVLECDGVNKTFSFDFKVFFPTDVAVVLSDDHGETEALVESRRYIVQLNDNQDVTPGGRITFTTPPNSGSSLVIYSAVPYLQPMVLTNHGGFYPKVLNDAQDRGVILAQQNRELIKRAVTVSFTSSETPEEFKKRFFAAHSETVESKNRAETASSQAKESAQTAQQASTHVDEVKRAVDATAQDVQAVQATADALKEEINRGSQAVASANTNAERINSQAQAMKSELDTLKTTVHNDAQQAEQAKNETLALKTSVEASVSAASRHATEARSASETAQQASTHVDEVKRAVDATAQDVQAAQATADALKGRVESALADVTRALSGQVQADWTETDTGSKSFIRNKPTNLASTWDTVQGKPTQFPPASHTHQMDEIGGLQSAFGAKANVTHQHTITDITNLQKYGKVSQVEWADITGVPNFTTDWGSLIGKPSTFTPPAKYGTVERVAYADIDGVPAQVDTSTLVAKTGNRGYLAGYEQVTFTKYDGRGFQYDPTVPVYAPQGHQGAAPAIPGQEKPTSFDVASGLLLTIDKNTPDTLTVRPTWRRDRLTVVFLRSSETTNNELDKYYSATKLILIQRMDLIQFKDDLESFRYWDGSAEQTLDLSNRLRIHKTNGGGGVVMFPDNQPLKMGDAEDNLLMAVHIHGDMVFVSKVASW